MTTLIQDSTHVVKSFPDGATGLTLAGWIFLAIVWTTVISLLIFCYQKILQKSSKQRNNTRRKSRSSPEESGSK